MQQTLALKDIAKQFSVLDPRFTNVHAKIYSIVTPNIEQFEKFLHELKLPAASAPNRHPFNVLVGDLSSVVPLQSSMVPSIKDGNLVMNSFVSDAKLPNCTYLCILSPFIRDANATHYGDAFASINFVRAFLSLNFGSLVQYTSVAEIDFDTEGQISLPGAVLRVPMFADLARFPDPAVGNETAERLALQLSDMRQKVRRACDFMSHALNQKDEAFRFSAYWISLEILSGTSDAIKEELAKAYGESKKYVEDALCFREFADMRVQLMHFGEFPTLLAYHERLFHLYFWEIVRHQIGLPCRKLALELIKSGVVEAERTYRDAIRDVKA